MFVGPLGGSGFSPRTRKAETVALAADEKATPALKQREDNSTAKLSIAPSNEKRA
jgi:hypothetical protein